MRHTAVVWVLFGCASTLAAEDRQDALKELIAKSEYVICAELSADPTMTPGEAGAVAYKVDVKVVAVLKNRPPREVQAIPKHPNKGESSVLKFTRTEFADEDKLPFLKKGSKCIFFMNYKPTKSFEGFYAPEGLADVWLGIQPYSPSLAKTVSDLGKKDVSPEKK